MQPLVGWECALEIMPMTTDESKTVFHDMLVYCKVNKFLEIKYKILTRILVTSAVLSVIHRNPALSKSGYCGERANIEHILLECPCMQLLHHLVMKQIRQINPITWIFGGAGKQCDPVICMCNFAIYKAHLMHCHGKLVGLEELFINECYHFASVYSGLKYFLS